MLIQNINIYKHIQFFKQKIPSSAYTPQPISIRWFDLIQISYKIFKYKSILVNFVYMDKSPSEDQLDVKEEKINKIFYCSENLIKFFLLFWKTTKILFCKFNFPQNKKSLTINKETQSRQEYTVQMDVTFYMQFLNPIFHTIYIWLLWYFVHSLSIYLSKFLDKIVLLTKFKHYLKQSKDQK